MTTTTLPSGTDIVSSYTHDNADRLTNIAHVKGGSTTVASVAYTLDEVGNRTQRVDQQGTHTSRGERARCLRTNDTRAVSSPESVNASD